ncbi:hypothetical protein A2U01_0079339, partial [Trifolium medium]|nr:hypothetical protein [Trifolium medium]
MTEVCRWVWLVLVGGGGGIGEWERGGGSREMSSVGRGGE